MGLAPLGLHSTENSQTPTHILSVEHAVGLVLPRKQWALSASQESPCVLLSVEQLRELRLAAPPPRSVFFQGWALAPWLLPPSADPTSVCHHNRPTSFVPGCVPVLDLPPAARCSSLCVSTLGWQGCHPCVPSGRTQTTCLLSLARAGSRVCADPRCWRAGHPTTVLTNTDHV